MKTVFSLILFLISLTWVIAQSPNHLFVYLEDAFEEEHILTYGNFKIENERLVKDQVTQESNKFFDTLDSILIDLPVENRSILFYIHGLWADTEGFYEPSSYILQEKIFDPAKEQYGLVISLQWEGLLNYKKDIELTQKVGSLFAPIISQIDKHLLCYNQNGNTAYLCHSMGNRVFLSLLHELQNIDTMAPIFHLFLCAADLPDDVLQDSLLYSIIKNTKSSSIYYNHGDRTLAVAATAVPGQRLGISGPRENPYLDNLKLINVTHYNDFESIPGKLSLHRYFYDSPRVRKQILSTLIQN